jgi:hypothetical protein
MAKAANISNDGCPVARGSRLAAGLLASIAVAALLFRHRVIDFFDLYDHILDAQAFALIMRFRWLPSPVAHDGVMALGFVLLGLVAVLGPAALGARRSWVAIALLFLVLNGYWWYSVEREVVELTGASMAQGMKFSALRTYIGNSLGACAGAFGGQWLAAKALSRPGRRTARQNHDSASAPSV